MSKEQAMNWLEKVFSFKLEQQGNAYQYELTVWNEYGLSIKVESHSITKCVELASNITQNEYR